MKLQTAVSILLIVLTGCDQPRAATPQASPVATEQTQPAVEPLAPATLPESTTEPVGQADEFTGKVVGIIDGDTIDILTVDKTKIRIRLNGIDAPETGQLFGKNAKQLLSDFIGGMSVWVVAHDKDRYGRTIGDVFCENAAGPDFQPGTYLPPWNFNRELVKRGLAWHYKKYSDDENLAMDKIRPKDLTLGLWSDARSIPPWEWRTLSKVERDKLR